MVGLAPCSGRLFGEVTPEPEPQPTAINLPAPGDGRTRPSTGRRLALDTKRIRYALASPSPESAQNVQPGGPARFSSWCRGRWRPRGTDGRSGVVLAATVLDGLLSVTSRGTGAEVGRPSCWDLRFAGAAAIDRSGQAARAQATGGNPPCGTPRWPRGTWPHGRRMGVDAAPPPGGERAARPTNPHALSHSTSLVDEHVDQKCVRSAFKNRGPLQGSRSRH